MLMESLAGVSVFILQGVLVSQEVLIIQDVLAALFDCFLHFSIPGTSS